MELLTAANRKWKAFLIVLLTEVSITIALSGKLFFSDDGNTISALLGAVIAAFSAMNVTLSTYFTINVVQKRISPPPSSS